MLAPLERTCCKIRPCAPKNPVNLKEQLLNNANIISPLKERI